MDPFEHNGATFSAIFVRDRRRLLFRPMVYEDIDQVVEIEKQLFSSPWDRDAFEYELEQPCAESYVVAERDRVVAYLMAWSLLDEMHVLNVAVIAELQHQGIARNMLELVIDKAQAQQVRMVHLEVRESNARAIRLYEKIGFKTVGRRRKYYDNPTEDALLMTYFIN